MITTKTSRAGQVIFGGTLLAIAVTAGATGMWINVHHGLELRPEAGILFGLADLAKIVLPIVCGLIGWNLQTRLVAVVCVLTSIFCAWTAFNGAADHNIAGKQHAAAQYADAKTQVAKLETTVASLEAQVAAEAKNKGCGKQCKFLAERAEKASQDLTGARTALKDAAPASMAGNEQMTAYVTAALFLVLIEALVWLSIPAMQLIAQAIAKPVKAVVRKNRKTAKKAKKTDWTKPAAYTTAKMTKAGQIDRRTKAGRAVKKVTGKLPATV